MNEHKLPEGIPLQQVRRGLKQWSQIVAWTWTDYISYLDPEKTVDSSKADDEKKLKGLLLQTIKTQIQANQAWQFYGDATQQGVARDFSIKLKRLLMGIPLQDDAAYGRTNLKVSIPEVYKNMTGTDPDSFYNWHYMNQFHIEVLIDRFSGSISEISKETGYLKSLKEDERRNNHSSLYIRRMLQPDSEYLKYWKEKHDSPFKNYVFKEGDENLVNNVKYINRIAYPPCPALGPATVTEDELKSWMKSGSTSYLPPSPYIPVCES